MCTPPPVTEFEKARSNFLTWFEEQARLIRHQPKPDTIQEVKNNLLKHGVEYLDRLIDAAIIMACEAKDHMALQLRMPKLSVRLGINPKCDMCVHYLIESILADLGF
ncbi:unnamed protein product [Penicillium glandicola]